MKAIWATNTPYSKLLISVGIILISAVLFTLISTMLVSMVHGISMIELQGMMSDLTDPGVLSILKFVQTISALGTFVIPPLILAWLFSENIVSYLSLDKQPPTNTYLLVAVVMIVSTPVINFMGELNSQMHLPGFLKGVEEWMRASEEQAATLTKSFLVMDTTGDFLLNLLMIALIPAIGEELLFRGVVQKIFHQWSRNSHVAIWTTAILFSAMHMQFYGFLPRMALGGLLGYMLVWSGSLWLPILGHFVNNAGAVTFYYLFQQGVSSIDPDSIGTESDYSSIVASLTLSVTMIILLYRKRVQLIN
jgi:membrane protease YdiL (CAAX protease family)